MFLFLGFFDLLYLNIDLGNCFAAVILLEYGAIRKSWSRDIGSTVSCGRVAWETQFAS